MKGAGYYDQHSGSQLSAIQTLQDWFDDGVAKMTLPAHGRPVTIVDLGSSEGRNAVRLIQTRLLTEPERYSWHFIQVAALLTRR
jgi:hypothetical protein